MCPVPPPMRADELKSGAVKRDRPPAVKDKAKAPVSGRSEAAAPFAPPTQGTRPVISLMPAAPAAAPRPFAPATLGTAPDLTPQSRMQQIQQQMQAAMLPNRPAAPPPFPQGPLAMLRPPHAAPAHLPPQAPATAAPLPAAAAESIFAQANRLTPEQRAFIIAFLQKKSKHARWSAAASCSPQSRRRREARTCKRSS